MSTEKPTTGVGTKFYRWNPDNSSADKWERQANVMSISGPNKTRETIDVTTLDAEDGYMEFIAGLRDGGTFSIEFRFTHATYKQLNDDFEDDTPQNYKIVLPNESKTTLELEAYVTEVPTEIDKDSAITFTAQFKVSGKDNLGKEGSSGS